MGYGESQAYRAGMYETAEGYSFYPPNDEEEENDMAVEQESGSIIVSFTSGPTSSGLLTWYAANLSCGHKAYSRGWQPFDPSVRIGDRLECEVCPQIAKEVAWILSLERSQVHHIRFRPQFGGTYSFYKLDPTSPSNFFLIGSAAACPAVDDAIRTANLAGPISPTEGA